MRKINWHILNIAFWVELILSYILPFQAVGNNQYGVGCPISFLTVYDKKIGVTPLMSMHLNPVGLILNVVILYLILSFVKKSYQKLRRNQSYK